MQFLTLKQFIDLKKYPLSMSKMRRLLMKRDENGLSIAVRRLGGKLVIIPEKFEEWLDSQRDN